MIEIKDFLDERVKEFTLLKESTLLRQDLTIIESEKIFLKLIHNHVQMIKILTNKDFAQRHHLSGDHVFVVERSTLDKIAGFKTEYEVLALIKKPQDIALQQMPSKIISLNGLTSPENVGSIVRTAAAFNINGLLVDSKTCSPYLRRCIRVSMGNIFYMQVNHSTNYKQDLLYLKNNGYQIISTANLPTSIDYSNFKYPEKFVLIIGSEGHGIDRDILELSDKIIKIKINDNVAHLNAANAASIIMSQIN